MAEPSTRTRRIAALVAVLVALVLALLSPGWRHSQDDRARAADVSTSEDQATSECAALGHESPAGVCEDPVDARAGHVPDHAAPVPVATTDLLARSQSLGLIGDAFDLADPDGFSPLELLGPAGEQPELIAMNLPIGDSLPGSGVGLSPWSTGLVPGPLLLGRLRDTGGDGVSGGGGTGAGGGGDGSFVPNERTGGETPGNGSDGGSGGADGNGDGTGDTGSGPDQWTPPGGGSPGGSSPGGPVALVQTTPPVETQTVPGPAALPLAGIGAALVALFRRRLGSRA